MKSLNLSLILICSVYAGCYNPREIRLEQNFNVILKWDNSDHVIDLKAKKFTQGLGVTKEEINFSSDSLDLIQIYISIPWKVVSKLPDYYNPSTSCDWENPSYDELRIFNGDLRKIIRLDHCTKYSDSLSTKAIFQCIEKINKVIMNKPEVKKILLLRFEA